MNHLENILNAIIPLLQINGHDVAWKERGFLGPGYYCTNCRMCLLRQHDKSAYTDKEGRVNSWFQLYDVILNSCHRMEDIRTILPNRWTEEAACSLLGVDEYIINRPAGAIVVNIFLKQSIT